MDFVLNLKSKLALVDLSQNQDILTADFKPGTWTYWQRPTGYHNCPSMWVDIQYEYKVPSGLSKITDNRHDGNASAKLLLLLFYQEDKDYLHRDNRHDGNASASATLLFLLSLSLLSSFYSSKVPSGQRFSTQGQLPWWQSFLSSALATLSLLPCSSMVLGR